MELFQTKFGTDYINEIPANLTKKNLKHGK